MVLTTDKNYKVKDTVIVHSVEEMVEELKKYNSEDVYVIGGESIYRQLELNELREISSCPVKGFISFFPM